MSQIKVGVASPAGIVDKPAFEAGIKILSDNGLRMAVPESVFLENAYLAGNDTDRAAGLNALFARPDISAIICARGGYGSLRILPYLDYDAIAAGKKRFVGFSDITALLVVLAERCGIDCAHGPVVSSLKDSSKNTVASVVNFLTFGVSGILQEKWVAEQDIIVPGTARGRLLGGNLTTFCHLFSTPYQPDYSGKIFFVEDINEPIYKIDRMLTQMRLSGIFDNLGGVILGQFINCGEQETLRRLFQQTFTPYRIPVVSCHWFGHGMDNEIIPLGVQCTIDTQAGSLFVGNHG